MPKDIHTQDSSQQQASRLLLAMGVIVLLGLLWADAGRQPPHSCQPRHPL